MSMDRTTEIIAHFIGDFALSVEIGRIRADYEKIRLEPEADPALAALTFKGLRLTPEHPLGELDPQIVYQPLPPSPFAIPVISPPPLQRPGPDDVIEVAPPPPPEVDIVISTGDIRIDTVLGGEMPPPSSVAAVLWMSNQLQDADAFGVAPGAILAQAAELAQILEVMSEQVAALSPLPAVLETLSGSPAGALDWAGLTAQITQAAEQNSEAPLGGVVLQGDATLGVHVDGAIVDALPDWQDLLPAFLREKETEQDAQPDAADGSGAVIPAQGEATDEEEEEEEDAQEEEAQEEDAPGDQGTSSEGTTAEGAGPPAGMTVIETDGKTAFGKAMTGLTDEGTTPAETAQAPLVVTGGNQLVNEVTITSNWLDAPVIVVGGDARELTAISQVNATFDRDAAPGAEAGAKTGTKTAPEAGAAPGDQPSSMVMNAASITSSSNPAPRDADQAGTSPSGFAIARITGDLVQVNGVQQYNFASDTDSLRIDIPSTRLQLSSGENELAILAVLNEFGWTFDLIVVGGDMVDATLIRQTNLLVDDDIVEAIPDPAPLDAPAPAPAPVTGATGEDGRGPDIADETPTVTPTVMQDKQTAPAATGETASASPGTSAPVPTAPSSPAPAPAKAPLQTSAEGAAPEETAKTVTGPGQPMAKQAVATDPSGDTTSAPAPAEPAAPGNLSYNEARIHTEGLDVAAKLPKALAEASKALTEGAEALGREVLGLDLFEGVELLKVLLIEGDFITANWIDQINILGDQDQVEILKAAIAALPEAQIVTEANLLANLASISKKGIDSQIMAEGESYSDALLHQAGFVEENAPAPGAGLTELASEAVAFLADGMIETAVAELEAGHAAVDSGLAAMSASQADLMQTMLS
ncbi:hypothetical protein [Limimaricola litoreus]|uniref:Uncharacterized protein n=1 Tax=Limimaricola litoreus TaxID=2955316 RepID=A0A9X2FPC0_9RHOB|nr:hypothetical protein [Limimaricola litoreus]MCP1167244.1 hypothetical protein [Limimaricola litoreus]